MERTTNSHDARRAADYLSKYCTDCVGCTDCIFDIGDEGQSCRINSGCAPVGWNLPSIWTAQDIALAKAMMPFAKTVILRARASAPSRCRQAHLIICALARLSVWPTL